MTHWLPAALLALLLVALPAAASTPDWSKAAPEEVAGGLEMAVDIEVAPDGAVWFVELAGNVSSIDVGGAKRLRHHVDGVVVGGERGLVGLALAHDFAQSGAFYLYYTQRTDDPAGGLNRLVRVEGGQETLLASVPGAKEHNGGRIAVARDGTLFVGTGENQLRDPAQDPDSPLGKILRLSPDGQPVAGNLKGLVYSKGHRNVYGVALHPTTGDPWVTENSGWRRDEVNVVKARGNYGYPECEGQGLNGVSTPCPTDKGYTFPVRTFYEDRTAAPTGATFWRGEFYWASLREGSIHHLWQDAAGAWQDEVVYKQDEPILDLAVGPDDALYFSTFGAIFRIRLANEDVGLGSGDTGAPTGQQGTSVQGAQTKSAAAPAAAAMLALGAAAMVARRRA